MNYTLNRMRVRTLVGLTVILLQGLFASRVHAAPPATIVCKNPAPGSRLEFQSAEQVEKKSAGRFMTDFTVTVFIDDPKSGKALIQYPGSRPSTVQVVNYSDQMISLLEHHHNRVWTYSFFPALRIAIYTAVKAAPAAYDERHGPAISDTWHTSCEFRNLVAK